MENVLLHIRCSSPAVEGWSWHRRMVVVFKCEGYMSSWQWGIFIATGNDNSDGFYGFLGMAHYLLRIETLPNVLNTSYAFNELGLDAASAINLCNTYM